MKNSNTHFLSLSGRLDRISYTRRYIAILVLTICIVGHITLTGIEHAPSIQALVGMMVSTWFIFHATLWTQVVKRLHDQGREGTMALLTFIPVFGLVYALIQAFKKGMDVPNQYGEIPVSDSVGFGSVKLNREAKMELQNAQPG